MKRTLLIPLIVLMLASLACSLGQAATPAAAPAEQTKPAVQSEKGTQSPAEPTATEAAAEQKIVLATATTAPTETPSGSAAFTDTFDETSDAWSDPIIVTSQASGHDPLVTVTSGDGAMGFKISDKETYVYEYLLRDLGAASKIEADFQNKGAINASIVLVCKANKELSSWYELRVSAADNNYVFYQYDKKRKDDGGKNPYVQLAKGHMKVEEYYPTRPNHIAFTCSDKELSVDVNKGKKTGSFTLASPIQGNIFGLGVLSADTVPVSVDFDTVVIQ